MTALAAAILFFSAVLGGGLNAVAGGGSFVTFPVLLFTGVPAISANATNAVALWPAGIASAIAYRRELTQPRAVLISLGITSLVGGGTGALLLLYTPDTTFVRLLPWLLLLASAMFQFGGHLAKRLRTAKPTRSTALNYVASILPQLAISLYGGYFGGGMGIMMIAVWSVMGMTNIHEMNGLKGFLGSLINGTAVVAFIIAHAVAWGPGIVMVLGATVGAYSGASLARRIDPKWVKNFALIVAWVMTAFFFVKTYWG